MEPVSHFPLINESRHSPRIPLSLFLFLSPEHLPVARFSLRISDITSLRPIRPLSEYKVENRMELFALFMERTNGKEKGKGGKVSRKLAFVKKKKRGMEGGERNSKEICFPLCELDTILATRK